MNDEKLDEVEKKVKNKTFRSKESATKKRRVLTSFVRYCFAFVSLCPFARPKICFLSRLRAARARKILQTSGFCLRHQRSQQDYDARLRDLKLIALIC